MAAGIVKLWNRISVVSHSRCDVGAVPTSMTEWLLAFIIALIISRPKSWRLLLDNKKMLSFHSQLDRWYRTTTNWKRVENWSSDYIGGININILIPTHDRYLLSNLAKAQCWAKRKGLPAPRFLSLSLRFTVKLFLRLVTLLNWNIIMCQKHHYQWCHLLLWRRRWRKRRKSIQTMTKRSHQNQN